MEVQVGSVIDMGYKWTSRKEMTYISDHVLLNNN